MDMNPDRQNSSKEGKLKSSSDTDRLDKKRTKAGCIVIVATVCFFLGALFLSLNNFLSYPSLFIAFLFFSFIVAPILGIIAALLWFPKKSIIVQFLLIGVIFVLSVLLFVAARMHLVVILPYIYTPPALTPKNLAVYNQCVTFAKNRDEDKTLAIGRGRVVIDGNFYMLVKGNTFERERARRFFSEQEVLEMEELCRRLFEVRCVLLKRDNDILVFYKWANSVLPVGTFEAWNILPVGPGVLYSLNGENPNKIHSEFLNTKKPFVRISGNWYMSRRLMLSGPRPDSQSSIPKALIDHSLRTKGLTLNNEADNKITTDTRQKL